MATVTRAAIRTYMINQFGLGRHGAHDGASGGGSSGVKIADASEFAGPRAAENIEVGCEVVITSGSAELGEQVRVTSRPNTTDGSFDTLPLFTTGLSAVDDDEFDIAFLPLRFDVGPYSINDSIDKALEKVHEKLLVPITLVTDGDMLGSGVGDFSGLDTGTLVKLAASFPLGIRELQVDTTAQNGTARCATIQVQSSGSYFLEATARVLTKTSMTAKLIVRDIRNSNNLSLDDDDTTEEYPTVLWNPNVLMLSTTAEVQLRLGADESGARAIWSNVQFRDNAARHFVIQDRMEIDRLGRLFATSDKDWRTRGDSLIEVAAEPHQLPAGLWEYRVGQSVAGMALFYEEFVKRSTLSSDTATTSAPAEEVGAVAAELLLNPLRADERWAPLWAKAAAESAPHLARYDAQREYVNKAPKTMPLAQV